MKKIANLVALIICVTLLFSAISKNSKNRQFNRFLYVDISHFTAAEEATARRVNKICAQYGGENLKILVKYDYDLPTTKFWNAYTQKLEDGLFLIVTSTDNEKTLHHEVAHVLTFEEEEIHGPSWKMMITKMGYPQEAARYKK